MAGDQKISQLTDGNPAQAGDQLVIDRSGVDFRISVASVAAAARTSTLNKFHGFTASSNASAFSQSVGFAWLAGATVTPVATDGVEPGYWSIGGGVVPWLTDHDLDMACLNVINTYETRFRPKFNSGTDTQSWVGFATRDAIAVQNPTLLFPAVPLTPLVAFKCRVPAGQTTWHVYVSQDTSGTNVTEVDTGVTYDETTWHTFRMEVSGNGTSIEFFIDGVSKAVVTTNIPPNSQPFSPFLYNESIGRSVTLSFQSQGMWWSEN